MLDYNRMERLTSNNSTGVSPKRFARVDYIKITVFGFGLSALWASLHTIILPLRLLDFVPEAQKNTYLDLLILTGLVLAMIVQPIAGAISDRSSFGWGRRLAAAALRWQGRGRRTVLLASDGLDGGVRR